LPRLGLLQVPQHNPDIINNNNNNNNNPREGEEVNHIAPQAQLPQQLGNNNNHNNHNEARHHRGQLIAQLHSLLQNGVTIPVQEGLLYDALSFLLGLGLSLLPTWTPVAAPPLAV
jgi:hypothetical protein